MAAVACKLREGPEAAVAVATATSNRDSQRLVAQGASQLSAWGRVVAVPMVVAGSGTRRLSTAVGVVVSSLHEAPVGAAAGGCCFGGAVGALAASGWGA